MKIKELVDNLNGIAHSKDFGEKLKKITKHDEFHKYVKERISPSIPLQLSVGLWDINLKENYLDKIIQYTRDFIPYKNSIGSIGKKGHFSNVTFFSICPEDLSIEELDIYFTGTRRKERIQSLKADIKLHQDYINRNTKELENLESEEVER